MAIDSTFFILMGCGFTMGMFAILIGGAMFFSLPIIQLLFPGLSIGSVVGNLKVGSLITFTGSTISTRKNIAFAKNLKLIIFAFIGTILGASFIANLDQSWVLPILVLAILISIFAPYIADLVCEKTYHFFAFIFGIYAGLFGAGNGILLVALLRIKYPDDTDIAYVKIQVRFIELVLAFTAVFTHFTHGNLITSIWLPWASGSFFGGIIGGIMLNKLGHVSGKIQKMILYISFIVALSVAFYQYIQ